MSSIPLPTKRCTRCGQSFPATLEYFHRHRKGRGGLAASCKRCHPNTTGALSYALEYRFPLAERSCAQCGQTFPATLEYFSRSSSVKGGLRAKCLRCDSASVRAWQRKQGERFLVAQRAAKRADYQHHRERRLAAVTARVLAIRERAAAGDPAALELLTRIRDAKRVNKRQRVAAPGRYTVADVARQYEAQRGLCFWCGEAVGAKYHVDHVIPLSRGGTHYPDNIVIACPPCNLSKNDKLPGEWRGPS